MIVGLVLRRKVELPLRNLSSRTVGELSVPGVSDCSRSGGRRVAWVMISPKASVVLYFTRQILGHLFTCSAAGVALWG